MTRNLSEVSVGVNRIGINVYQRKSNGAIYQGYKWQTLELANFKAKLAGHYNILLYRIHVRLK
jgi:hypothetical protein